MTQTTRPRISGQALALAAGFALAGLTACSGEQTPTQTPTQQTPPQQAPAPEETVADPVVSGEAALVENGRDIAEMHCAFCHAIGSEGDSPRADAPPLRTVLADYDPDALAYDFREGLDVGHPDMPDFNLGPKGTDSILAYLVSIQAEPLE